MNDLTRLIEQLEAAFDGPLDTSDLPESQTDPIAYLTDDEGEWDDLTYARSLLEARGPSGPAWVAIRELEEIERKVETLETRFLQPEEGDHTDSRDADGSQATDRIVTQIRAGEYLDSRVFDSIRAQLVVLAERETDPSDSGL